MSLESPKVLIVDDEEMVTKSLSRILSNNGYEVDIAHHPNEAAHLCELNFYSAVILDCLLPGKSGLQLAKEIKKTQDKNTHFIFISGAYSDPSFINSCLSEVGGSRFYTKPFNASILLDYLDQVLKGNYKDQFLLEKIYTLPNPSGAEIIQLLSESPKILGYELPFLLVQFSRFKLSRLVNIYIQDELSAQIRFHNGRIIQIFNFISGSVEALSPLESLNAFVNSDKMEIQLSPLEGVAMASRVTFPEIKSWAEDMTFKYLPIHFVIHRLLPVLACKIYTTRDFDVRAQDHKRWPVVESAGLELESITGISLLKKLFSSSRKNEDLFLCVYNYLLNGSAWVDSVKKSYDEEALTRFLPWHYNRISKKNYFEIFEINQKEKVEDSLMLSIYKRVLKEISDLKMSPEIERWIELEIAYLQSGVKLLDNAAERKIYSEELEQKTKRNLQRYLEIKEKLYFCMENNEPERLLSILQPLKEMSSAPADLTLLKIWADLKLKGSTFGLWHLRELHCEVAKLPIARKQIYLKKLVEGCIIKLEGDKHVARRYFNEAKRLKPECLAAEREIQAIDRPQSSSLAPWSQLFNSLLKKIDYKTKSA